MAAPPAPDGRHDDLDAADLEGLALLVPDDARSLDADRSQYLRELRGRARDERLRRALHGHLPPRGAIATSLIGPAVLVMLVVLGLVGSTLSVFGNTAKDSSPVSPLATTAAAAVGQVGGLLPDAMISVDGLDVPLRDSRPAMLVLVPTGCGDLCALPVRNLAAQAREYGLTMLLVAGPGQHAQVTALDDAQAAGTIAVADDPTDVLHTAYDPHGVTAVLVHSDGVVAAVLKEVTATQRMEPALVQLARPGASHTA
jgi:hypothetical protein